MHLSRLAAIGAAAAALSLAACSGGSPALGPAIGTTGQTGIMRFVQGSPQDGNVDIYLASTGTTFGTTPLVSGLGYARATDFTSLASTAYTVKVFTAGANSTTATPLGQCTIPQVANNAKYTIVLARGGVTSGSTLDCALFQDFDYTGTVPQYRFHNGSTSAGSLGNGFIASASAPPGTPFTVLGTAAVGTLASVASGVSYAQAQPTAIGTASSTTTVTFAAGAAAANNTTEPSYTTLGSQYLTSPNSATQPNTGGGLPYAGSPGTSIFAINCTAATQPSLPTGSTCDTVHGVALIGQLDTK